ncbi:helix-turn-helix transcriptional regulator [Apilactobacillus micheneri]|uniref:helix-turn-helix transcriptional regulator n=1 Tax=Apilactobacillus micheneri TaxID=1899430 RepID=UPI000D512539|nr:hypothetical protein NBRC113063_00112 [Apilactobacillus micheneri]
MRISSQLKKARKDKKLTQEYVASQINVSRKTISSWENGRGQPNSAYLKQLNSIYDTNLQLHYTKNINKNNPKHFNLMFWINIVLFILCLVNIFTGVLSGIAFLQLIFISFLCVRYKINMFIYIKNNGKYIIIYILIFILSLIFIMNNLSFSYAFHNYIKAIPFFIGAVIHSLILTSSFFIITNYKNLK